MERVLVTGGSQGIGRAIAARAKAAGYGVVTFDLVAPRDDGPGEFNNAFLPPFLLGGHFFCGRGALSFLGFLPVLVMDFNDGLRQGAEPRDLSDHRLGRIRRRGDVHRLRGGRVRVNGGRR